MAQFFTNHLPIDAFGYQTHKTLNKIVKKT